MSSYYFSRFHLVTSKNISDKIDFLLTGLRNDATTESHGFLYKFFNSEPFEFDGKEYITGHLVKYNPEDVEKVVSEDSMKIIEEDIKNKVVGMARYIIDANSSIIMFNEIPVISKETFASRFMELFEENHDNFFTEFVISPIKEQYSFVERIKEFKAVKKISIMLYPSNPHFADRWRGIDERLKSNNISRYREIQENNKSGENIKVDTETENKFLMAEDGYGNSSASGIDEKGEENTISTTDDSKHVSKSINFEITQVPEILKELYQTLKTVIARTQK